MMKRALGIARRMLILTGRTAIALALLLALLGGYLWFTTELPTADHLRAQAALGNTRILDREGRLLYSVPDPFAAHQRPVPLDDIPVALRQATIAIEDRSFFDNSGIDLRGIARAFWTNLRRGEVVAGGSTITQQLARTFLLDPRLAQQRTLERKLRETVLAFKLTLHYSKDDILAFYLNQTYYGGMNYGVEAAARHYFGKPVHDLDLAECALLAGLPQAPSHYNPLHNPAAAQARQAQVLTAMVHSGAIAPSQAAAARAEPLQFAGEQRTMHAPHFVYYVLDQLAAELGPDYVARGGLTITTTLDIDLQEAARDALYQQLALLAEPRDGQPDHEVHNGAVVVLDPASGDILAMVGSPDFYDATIQGQVNAALALRQPGSAMKPLTYAAALERGWTPASTVLDIPSSFTTASGQVYEPQNYDRRFRGPLSLREALATSSNVSAVRVLDAIGIPALLEMAERLGIRTLQQHSARYGLALTLGGGEVTLLELSAAYGAFATSGQQVVPRSIRSIASSAGTPAPEVAPPAPGEQVLSPQIAYLISDILADPYARMAAFGVPSVLDIDRPAAVKTGTTTDWRDNWTMGYTPDRVVGVWVGNAGGEPMQAITGITGAGPVWHTVMLAAHRGLPQRPFARPDGIVEREICAEGGLLPTAACPATRLERFVAGTEPTRPDDTHVQVAIDPRRDCRIVGGAPADSDSTVLRTYRLLPPEAEAWAVAAGVPRIPERVCPAAQPTAPAPELPRRRAAAPRPALVAPAPGAVFALNATIPPERQRIEIAARAGVAGAQVTLLVDNKVIAELDAPPYRTLWPLEPGEHRAHVEVRDGQGQVWRSEEIVFTVIGG
jgi:1A family penicillin-binding protein